MSATKASDLRAMSRSSMDEAATHDSNQAAEELYKRALLFALLSISIELENLQLCLGESLPYAGKGDT